MRLLPILLLFCFAPTFQAAPPTREALQGIAANYLANRPLAILERGFSSIEARNAQQTFIGLLTNSLGPVTGYKIGLITKPNQERLGATGPVHGTLLKKMLHDNGAAVPAQFGVRPAIELDMGVLVKDAEINNAKSLNEIVAHLSHLVCFIELVDTITATNQTMDASLLVALNVGARGGVLGEKTLMTAEVAKALPTMKMTLATADGKTLVEIPALGLQPLENIQGLITALAQSGRSLKAGDFISLGSPAAPQPVPAAQTVLLKYENLPSGPLSARVSFTP